MNFAYVHSPGCGSGFIQGMDARAKIFFSFVCIVIVIASGSPAVPLFVGASCGLFLAASGVSARLITLRLAGPLLFALPVAALQAFSLDDAGAIDMAVKGSATLARVFGAVMAVLFMAMTTPAHRLLTAAAWFRLPRDMVELLLLTYRYVFVLIDDAFRVFHAQRGRLGYAGMRVGLGSLGTLCGSVFLRAFDQAEAAGAAMAMRGYTGEYVPACRERLRVPDALFLLSNLAVCLGLFVWTS